MREADAPRMEMELVVDAVRHIAVAMIFLIAEDGVAEDRHMGAELMLPPSDRLQRQPRRCLPRPVNHRMRGDRGLPPLLLAGPGFAPAAPRGTRRFDQGCVDFALQLV